MLQVRVNINADTIINLHAQRMSIWQGENFTHKYHAFWSTGLGREYMGEIRHKYSSGASELAVKLLRLHNKKGPK